VKLHLGCGKTILPDWTNLDLTPGDGVDIIANLDQCATIPLPFDDNTVDEFLAMHLIEHLHHPLDFMAELWRIAKPDALITLATPYGTSDDAWEDPTHTRPYFMGSWGYFGQPFYWNKDYGYRGDWQHTSLELSIWDTGAALDGDQIMHRIRHDRNIVAEMVSQLHAVKPIRPADKALQQQPEVTLRLVTQ
jgi:SAM-dependent methyltransferase